MKLKHILIPLLVLSFLTFGAGFVQIGTGLSTWWVGIPSALGVLFCLGLLLGYIARRAGRNIKHRHEIASQYAKSSGNERIRRDG